MMIEKNEEAGTGKREILETQKIFDVYRLSPISIEVYDHWGHLIDANQSCLNLFGIQTMEEVRDFNLFKDPNLSDDKIEKIRNGLPVNYELEFDFDLVTQLNLYRTSRSGRCALDCFINPVYDGNQVLNGYIIYLIEITERKKAEMELVKSEERFRNIVENSTRGMYFFELDQAEQLILTGANPAADQMLGINHKGLLGLPIEVAFPRFGTTENRLMYQKIARGESGPAQFDTSVKNGFIDKTFNVHVFQTGSSAITVNFTDITDQKEAEKIQFEQAQALREINTMKDKLMSIIAHDLRGPFNAILGFSDLLLKNADQRDDIDREMLVKGLTTIDQAARDAYQLLEELLAWAQNQSGRIRFSPEKLNLNREIREIVRTFQITAAKKNINFKITIKKEIDIFADRDMLDTIIRNLVSNALKFSYPEGTVRISASSSDKGITVSVADQGIGINPENLSAIFEIDKQTHTSGTEHEKGTGLGLNLCKEFVSRHGGKIWAKSTFGKGSTFSFMIPVH